MGVVVFHSTKTIMKTFVALSALVSSALAAPAAEADAQLLASGYSGLAGAALAPATATYIKTPGASVYSVATDIAAAPAVASYAAAAPAAATYAAVPVATYAAAPVATVRHTVHQPIVPVHQVREQVVTAPVVRQVGTQVHHQVQHIPQTSVNTQTSQTVSTHVINHAPQVGGFIAPAAVGAALPVAAAAVPAVAGSIIAA